MPLDRAQQVGLLLGAVGERLLARVILELDIEDVGGGVIQADRAVEAQLLAPPTKLASATQFPNTSCTQRTATGSGDDERASIRR